MISINAAGNDAAHVRVFQALAAHHIPGANTWPATSVLVVPRDNLIAQLTTLLGAASVVNTDFVGIKISSNHVDTPLAIAYQSRLGEHHQVTSGMGSVSFFRLFIRDPVSRKYILPSQFVLASASYASFNIRVYYRPIYLRTLD